MPDGSITTEAKLTEPETVQATSPLPSYLRADDPPEVRAIWTKIRQAGPPQLGRGEFDQRATASRDPGF